MSDNSVSNSLRTWWLSPPRSGLQLLINPIEYRRLLAFGVTRVVGGGAAAAVGALCLPYGAYGWAAFFLVVAALDLACGFWYLSIDPAASARTGAGGTRAQ